MKKKDTCTISRDAIGESLLQELEEFRVTKTRAESVDVLVGVALEVYLDKMEGVALTVKGKFHPQLPGSSKMGYRQRRVPRQDNELMGKIVSLLPYLNQEDKSSGKT